MARSKKFDEREVLKKAMELFWQRGFENTSMQELVDYMGIHRRSIYDTFGDKHRLFLSALSMYEENIANSTSRIATLDLSPKEQIKEVFLSVIYPKQGVPKGCLLVNAATELALRDQEVADQVTAAFARTEDYLHSLLELGQQAGEISSDKKPENLSHYLQNSLVGIRVLVKVELDKKKLESIVDTTLSVLN